MECTKWVYSISDLRKFERLIGTMLFGVVTVEELIVVDFLRPPTADCEFENEFSEYFFKLLFKYCWIDIIEFWSFNKLKN